MSGCIFLVKPYRIEWDNRRRKWRNFDFGSKNDPTTGLEAFLHAEVRNEGHAEVWRPSEV